MRRNGALMFGVCTDVGRWEYWDFCLIICCCFTSYPNATLRDFCLMEDLHFRPEGIMVKQIERSLMGLGFGMNELRGDFFVFSFFPSLIATIGGKEVSKSNPHPTTPSKPPEPEPKIV